MHDGGGMVMKRPIEKAPASEGQAATKRSCRHETVKARVCLNYGLCKQELWTARRSENYVFGILTKAMLKPGGQTAPLAWPIVPEPRLLIGPSSTTEENYYATVQYVDTARRARKSAAESLATLRDVDAIARSSACSTIRACRTPGRHDPLRDATNLDLELILFGPMNQISKRLERVEKDLKKKEKTRCSSWRKTFWKKCRRTWKQRNRCGGWN